MEVKRKSLGTSMLAMEAQTPRASRQPSVIVNDPSPFLQSQDTNMSEKKSPVTLNEDICVHVFTASAAMVGVCITVIGIFQVVGTLKSADSIGDDLLAINAILYLITTLMSYWSLRTRQFQRNHFMEKLIDILFLVALTCTTGIAGFITWAITFT